jgi:hypothetical protein
MRKQYHFWPGEQGLDACDVDRLIRLTAGLPVVEVPLHAIRDLHTPYWAFPGSPAPTVRELIGHMRLVRDVDPQYPVILGSDGRVMDGMHRIVKAVLDGRTTIRAFRFDPVPEPDFRDVDPDDLPYDEEPPDRCVPEI